jgi:formylglycine-generating enzyme required for sulfatase activity
MNGNVSEWSDDWHFKKYATDSETDSGVLRMLRGGSYEDNDNGLDLPTPKTRYSASFSLSGRGNTLLAFSPVIRYKEGSRFPLPKRTRRHP